MYDHFLFHNYKKLIITAVFFISLILLLCFIYHNNVFASTQEASTSGQSFSLTVLKTGTGSGTISSSPSGINCGNDCNQDYNSGTGVVLAATPASGSSFGGWSGDCSGTATCALTMDANKSVTATFTSTPPPPPPPPPSGGGGGGGGGGGIISPSTNITFSGRAYPKSSVTILKDAQIVATTIAGSNANFSVKVSGLSTGNYIFSAYSEDNQGIRSALLTFPVSVTSGSTQDISGIFIAPSIAVDKSEVRRGDNISIFGQTVPMSDVVISVNSEEEFFARTVADNDGVYLYNFNTAFIEYGNHTAKSKASVGNVENSGFSAVVGFIVGTKNVAKVKPVNLKGDLNNDGRVNLVDFSIASFWYRRALSPEMREIECEQLNCDGKIDLVDFSIMAFHWTG